MLRLSLPLILANVTLALISATDVLLMGRLSAHAVAAAALGLNLVFPFTLFGLGVITASSPLMATALGARHRAVRDVRRTFVQSMWAIAALVPPCWLLLWNAESIILRLGQEPALARDAATFVRGYMWSILPFLVFQAIRNFVSALERPGSIVGISVGGIVLNALLGWGLIFGQFGLPRLGIFGGGLASSLVWALLAAGMMVYLQTDRQFRRFHLLGAWWRADWSRFTHIWRIGLPIGLAMALEAAVFGATTYLMGLIDADSVAAHAIALQVAQTTFMVPLGIAQAATIRVGLGLGRQNPSEITRSGWTAFILAVGFMAAMAVLLWLFPHQLVLLVLADSPANARAGVLAAQFLLVAALFQIADGAQVTGAGMLRGLHDTKVPMLISAFGYWVVGIGVGTALAFGAGWDGVGLWAGLATGLAIVAVLLLLRWSRRETLGLILSGHPLTGSDVRPKCAASSGTPT